MPRGDLLIRFAHSLPETRDEEKWERLDTHLRAVATKAARFARPFGLAAWAEAAGLLHDIGKNSDAFQLYIRGKAVSPDHSTAGARAAESEYGAQCGRLLAFAIAGHHAGLADGRDLVARLKKQLPPYEGWQRETGQLPALTEMAVAMAFSKNAQYPGFHIAFLARMVFSCLVDADFLETEAFYAAARGESVRRGSNSGLPELRDNLRAHMGRFALKPARPLQGIRSDILAHATAKAVMEPGLFTMTVPTGGGKTLASLSFALEHAVIHNLRRVIYVAPYTAIIEQTAQVFRAALNTDDDILEHHSNFDWETSAEEKSEADADGLKRLRLATENWDAPIIVTTAVQFFESLFAARTGRCRKLHNIARSVVVLDEAQTLPLGLLRPCMAALDELARNYGASIVLCTATQPALRIMDGALPRNKLNEEQGFDIGPERELAPNPQALYIDLKRVRVQVLPAPVEDAAIAARFGEQAQMLCIVNTRGHAKALFELIRDLPGARHLTTLMCPAHRRQVLDEIKSDLKQWQPVRLVATSLVEAGVDFSFPEVWRAETGLDSIAQAAGRCNREGEMEAGRVVVFKPAAQTLPRAFLAGRDAALFPLQMDEPLGLAAVHQYFKELYFNRGYPALDAVKIDEKPGILPAIARTPFNYQFTSIALGFKMIDETMRPVIVPWDDQAKKALEVLRKAESPPGWVLRKLQQYTVAVPEKTWQEMLKVGAIESVNPHFGDRFVALENLELYDKKCTGLSLGDPTSRTAEGNII
jgi:CRISPR-associated endonuclease/helicase Cas3